MAKTSSVYRNLKRAKMAEKFASRRNKLKKIVMDKTISPEERFQATLKLAEMPRNSAKNRYVMHLLFFFFLSEFLIRKYFH